MRNALIFSITIMLCVGGYFYYTQFVQKELQISDEPKKTEYGTVAPQDFPQELLFEVGKPFEQSYALEYPEQKQRTVVFESEKTIEEIQKIYTVYLIANNWVITSNSVDRNLVAFYAKKDTADINIVAIIREGKAQVSVSIVSISN